MKTFLLYIAGLVALMVCLTASIAVGLVWPSIALGVALVWQCAAMYGRIGRTLYAYRETEKENERLHTRLAEAERQLQYLRQLTENVDTALFVCDTDGRIDWMNHAAKAYPQPSPARLCRLLPKGRKKGGEFLPTSILQAIGEGAEVVEGCALSTVLLRIDGQRRLVVALKDVSALMQRQEMEAWQQLIRVLTHEIMNSLTPIISISETLTSENEAFAVINRRCHALLDFVESYRQLTRIKTPECTVFPVSELFEHIKALFPEVATPLPHREGQEGGSLFADRAQLEQVLINLVRNAYESGATEVVVSAEDGEIRVRDNGSGMSPDVLDHAFIPFFTTKEKGTGIGLSLCRQIILKHGGTIRVESEEGRGTTFIIKL